MPGSQHQGVPEPVRAGAPLRVRWEPSAFRQRHSVSRPRPDCRFKAGCFDGTVQISQSTVPAAQEERALDVTDEAVNSVSEAMRLQMAVVQLAAARQSLKCPECCRDFSAGSRRVVLTAEAAVVAGAGAARKTLFERRCTHETAKRECSKRHERGAEDGRAA
jgi:hypothetical protein